MKPFIKFLLGMLKIGCIGFGGGSALIPVIEQEFIGTDKLDTKKNYDKDILVANLTPGALPVELAASLGLRNYGYIGMILGAFVIAFPGVIATILLLTALSSLRQNATLFMEIATLIVSAFIIGLIIKYIHNVCVKSREFSALFLKRSIVVMLGVFVLSCGKNLYKLLGLKGVPPFCLSTLHILAAAFVVIIGINIFRGWRTSGKSIRDYFFGKRKNEAAKSGKFHFSTFWQEILRLLVVWIGFLLVLSLPAVLLCLFSASNNNTGSSEISYFSYLGRGCLSVLMSFGGGDAYLAVADGLFVESGIVSSDVFYGDIVSIANILPGSILGKALTAIGYYYGISVTGSSLGGLCFALGGFAMSITVSCSIFGIIYTLYDHLSDFKSMKTISHYIGPIISGLLGTVILALLIQCKNAILTILTLL